MNPRSLSLFVSTFIVLTCMTVRFSLAQALVNSFAPPSTTSDQITQTNNKNQIVFSSGKQPILAYNHELIRPPKGIDELYARSGHIHPVYTPGGRIVTDDFSDDHAHQHGVFNAFVKARFEGKPLDFWNQHKRTANVKSSGVDVDQERPNRLKTGQLHYRLKDNKTIFSESWLIEASKQEGCFIIDLTFEIENVTDKTVVIEKNHYGSFGIRGSGQWRDAKKSEFQFATSTGKDRENGNLSRENWVAMHGKIDGEFCGVAVIGHSTNFRHPQPARLHPKMPYFSFAPMALSSYEIESGASQKSRFRIVTFDGKLNRKLIDQLSKNHGR